ncbi:hypothetical protein DYH10_02975 [Candidatus Saccharibacteria bacterium CPR2]|nr:hypothetical protein [Candidatus Saccharibacteria bacterium CPR2]
MEKGNDADLLMGGFEMEQKEYSIRLIAPNGLGFGEGDISAKKVGVEARDAVKDAVETRPDSVLVDIDEEASDDGCGDGRFAEKVFNRFGEFKRSLNRAKVFGGSAIMMGAALIGMGRVNDKDESLNEVFKSSIGLLMERGIDFGAHTDDHAHGENCGCGAIDKAPDIIRNVGKYHDHIVGSLRALLGDDVDNDIVKNVLGSFRNYSQGANNENYSGKDVKNEIVSKGKIVKELEGSHKEVAIIINTVRGKTVNQGWVREITNNNAQVFAVDMWRLEDISHQAFDNDVEKQKALLSMLVYTLSTAATLTKGDLPVYIVSEKTEMATVA